MTVQMSGAKVIALFGFAGVILGAFLPWAHVLFFSVSGLDGDGVITLILGVIGAALITFGRRGTTTLVAALVGVVACGIGLYDSVNLSIVAQESAGTASVGAGLWLTIFASALAVVASVSDAVEWEPSNDRLRGSDGGVLSAVT